MKTAQELIDRADPAFPLIQDWVRKAAVPATLLPPSKERERVLVGLQVSTRSTMGAMAYERGGMLVDGGWLRVLGSGHAKLSRNLADWNKTRGQGFWLVADDVVGGSFAVNAGRSCGS